MPALFRIPLRKLLELPEISKNNPPKKGKNLKVNNSNRALLYRKVEIFQSYREAAIGPKLATPAHPQNSNNSVPAKNVATEFIKNLLEFEKSMFP